MQGPSKSKKQAFVSSIVNFVSSLLQKLSLFYILPFTYLLLACALLFRLLFIFSNFLLFSFFPDLLYA